MSGHVEELLRAGAESDPSGLYTASLRKDIKSGAYSETEVTWAISRGFAPSTVLFLGIDESNIADYLPERDYFAGHPYNRWSVLRVNDKLTMRYSLSAFRQRMPAYWALIAGGSAHRLPDWSDGEHFSTNGETVIPRLVSRFGSVVVKRLGGCGGDGFAKVESGGGVPFL